MHKTTKSAQPLVFMDLNSLIIGTGYAFKNPLLYVYFRLYSFDIMILSFLNCMNLHQAMPLYTSLKVVHMSVEGKILSHQRVYNLK